MNGIEIIIIVITNTLFNSLLHSLVSSEKYSIKIFLYFLKQGLKV